MNNPLTCFYNRWPAVTDEESNALLKVLESQRWGGIFSDSYSEKLEHEFSKYCDTKYSVTVSSGSAGLLLALKALGVKEGDEVIVPAFSFIATATAVTWCGGTPVFVDVNPETLCIDPSAIVAAITPRTVAIIAVHLWGNVCDMKEIMDIAHRNGLCVVEDACQAIGANLSGKKVGSWGDCGVFSFAANKTISCGEGGMVVTENYDLMKRVAQFRNHGRLTSDSNLHSSLGFNFKMTEFGSALAIAQINRINQIIAHKNINYNLILEALSRTPLEWGLPIHINEDAVMSPFGFVLRHTPSEHKDTFEEICEKILSSGIPVSTRRSVPMYENHIYLAGLYPSRNMCTNVYTKLFVFGQPLGYQLLTLQRDDIEVFIEKLLAI